MSIFGSTAQNRDLMYRSGDLHLSQPWADEFTERLSNKMNRWGAISKTKTAELTSEFEDANLREQGTEVKERKLKAAQTESQKALEAIEQSKETGGGISSLSKLIQTRNKKKQNLKRAKQALERAQEFYKATGTNFTYEETGYDTMTPEADFYETQFDLAVEQRKQEYVEMYGFENFEDLQEGYAMTDYTIGMKYYDNVGGQGHGQSLKTPEYSGNPGQRDIMDMVMSDIIGMDYGTLAKLNTIDLQDTGMAGTQELYAKQGNLRSYTADQMEVLKDFFVTSNIESYKAASSRAKAEDRFRKQAAKDAEGAALRGAIGLEKSSAQEIGQSKEQVQLQLRELDQDFMKKIGAFKTSPKKRKVRQVSFTKDRPV